MVFRKLQVLMADSDQGSLVILMVQTLGGNRRHLVDHQAPCSYDSVGTARPEDAMIVGRAEVGRVGRWQPIRESISGEIPDSREVRMASVAISPVCGLLATRI